MLKREEDGRWKYQPLRWAAIDESWVGFGLVWLGGMRGEVVPRWAPLCFVHLGLTADLHWERGIGIVVPDCCCRQDKIREFILGLFLVYSWHCD